MKTTLFLCCFVFCILFSQLSHAQWVQTNGPYGTGVYCFAANGANIFAGTNRGVYVSADSGITWTHRGLSDVRSLLFINDTTILAGCYLGFVRSTDRGGTWRGDWNSPLSNHVVYSLAISESKIYAGTDKGLFVSSDNGIKWIQIRIFGDFSVGVFSIAVTGTNIYIGTAGVSIFRASSKGTDWQHLDVPYHLANQPLINALMVKEKTIYAAIDGAICAIYSTNNGDTWEETAAISSDSSIRAFASSGTALFAGTKRSGIFRSADSGTTWQQSGLTDKSIQVITFYGTRIFAGTIDGGVYISADNGDTWIQSNFGMQNSISAIAGNDSTLFAGTTDAGIFLSTNNGATWSQKNKGLVSMSVADIVSSGTDFLVSTSYNSNNDMGGLYRSTDQGTSWKLTNIPRTDIYALAVGKTTLFVGARGACVYRSSDNGSIWNPTTTGLPSGVINSIVVQDTVILVGVSTYPDSNGGVFTSIENSTVWTRIGLPYVQSVYSLAMVGNTIFTGTSNGCYFSTDGGLGWINIDGGLSGAKVYSLAVSGKQVFAGTDNQGIFVFNDTKSMWNEANTGLASLNISSLFVSKTYVFAGTFGSGVWRRPLSELLTAAEEPTILPEKATFKQNYPNPATADTKITFSLPAAGFATLKVFNALGLEVTTLLAEDVPAGTHTATWNVSNSQSGTYFCRLQSSAITETMKLTVLH